MEKNAYLVTAKCGHVGRGNYIEITFPVQANTKKEAAYITRYRGRVKHDWSDAIVSVEQVDWSTYHEKRMQNKMDPFLNVHSSSGQREFAEQISSRTISTLCGYEKDPFERKQRADFRRKRYYVILKERSSEVFA